MYDKGYNSIKEYYQLLDVLNDEAGKKHNESRFII